jgi:hypothetical protein
MVPFSSARGEVVLAALFSFYRPGETQNFLHMPV